MTTRRERAKEAYKNFLAAGGKVSYDPDAEFCRRLTLSDNVPPPIWNRVNVYKNEIHAAVESAWLEKQMSGALWNSFKKIFPGSRFAGRNKGGIKT